VTISFSSVGVCSQHADCKQEINVGQTEYSYGSWADRNPAKLTVCNWMAEVNFPSFLQVRNPFTISCIRNMFQASGFGVF